MAIVKTYIPESLVVLHLEDMTEVFEVMVSHLREFKINSPPLHATTIKEAVEILKSNKPDLIILDWNLPDGAGIDLLKKIKESKAYKDIPILMCTTVDEVENILDAIKLGANDYIVKPWQKEELFKKINLICEKL
jgi:DNA-binding response OmpR family regulator